MTILHWLQSCDPREIGQAIDVGLVALGLKLLWAFFFAPFRRDGSPS